MDWFLQLLAATVTLILIPAVYRLLVRDDPGQVFVKALPGGVLQAKFLSRITAKLRSITSTGDLVAEGYRRVSAFICFES